MTEPIVRLNADDDVAVALEPLVRGTRVAGIDVAEDIPRGHKVALRPIAAGAAVRKFGQAIGVAAGPIGAGRHVHLQNLDVPDAARMPGPDAFPAEWEVSDHDSTFEGFLRNDGRAGTRNYVGVVATVNCSATVVRKIAEALGEEELATYANVDGIVPITHTSGCGMAANGDGLKLLRRTLRGFIRHPNFGGVLVVGLGCEMNEVGRLLDDEPAFARGPDLRSMTIQEAGGTRAAIERGARELREILAIANEAGRQALPVRFLTLGLQCGASDAYSGISANPALGFAADRLVRAGGTVLLAETPEIYGAEHLLLARAESAEVAKALEERLVWWQDYAARHGSTLNNNPSPGNVEGGISTILEKSLGAVAKSGSSPLRAVIDYGAPVPVSGFAFMDSPGYDPCSVTGEIASGANLIAFTTGRGSVFGAKPAPSIKLATNSELAARMSEDIDYDCGAVLDGKRSLEDAGGEIFQLLLDTASGRASASEASGFGDLEFVPWQLGAVL